MKYNCGMSNDTVAAVNNKGEDAGALRASLNESAQLFDEIRGFL